MECTELMVRYGELSTKGKNRKYFIKRLEQNVNNALSDLTGIKIRAKRDRMHIMLNGIDGEIVADRLKKISGIQTFSPVYTSEKNIKAIKEAAIAIMGTQYKPNMSFKINTKRADHDFEHDTNEINQLVGQAIVDQFKDIQVKMKNPDCIIRIEIRLKGVFISTDTVNGAGGMPIGTGGKGMLMLSGGIDSPVAGYLAMKRGVEIEAVHFHSPPYTSPQALKKAKQLTAKLAAYSGSIRFIEVPFTEIQEEIKKHVPEGYSMTITRRMMMRLTDRIREMRKGKAIINGESLGQVASQTLESMYVINEVTHTPVLRPVITLDKNEIIAIAKNIDTFDLSIQPFEDCCTIFAPPRPKTKPKLDRAIHFENRLNGEEMIERALSKLIITEIHVGEGIDNRLNQEISELL
ncbi:tRNA uracil 4-sulfurtransferase ThiI [Lacticigenium naphthae]|uniref:tRNA uracil 4-sulfurtransferase ThiI n=1 Tax=Lacticigenium naphthae TaxID=515351 RepID=UPI0004227F83|nr:tRNA uracil 4-sulfurtransferase ThiI [Lacticigenium naphthae]